MEHDPAKGQLTHRDMLPVSISHIGMEPRSSTIPKFPDLVSISHIGMEQQHLVVKKHYNTYILICQ